MDAADFFALIVQGLQDIQVTRLTQLSSSSIIVFDHLITFGEEVELIWKSTWTLGKVLFLLNRYYSLAAVIFNNYAILAHTVDTTELPISDRCGMVYFALPTSCRNFYRWQGWTGLIACLLAEAILQMRLYALYSLNKKILALMLSCWIACLTLSAYVMYTVLAKLTVTVMEIPGGVFCVPNNVSPHFYLFWIPMLVFESLLCTLALIRGLQTYRSNGTLFHSGRELVAILIRDSVVYFLVICGAYLTCLLIWIVAPVGLLDAPIGFSLAMSCVLANRVVLNVRRVSRDVNNASSAHRQLTSQKGEVSFTSPETLTSFEMRKLRTLRAERNMHEILDRTHDPEEGDPPKVVVL